MNPIRLIILISLVLATRLVLADEVNTSVSAKYIDKEILLDISIQNDGRHEISQLNYEIYFGKNRIQGSQQELHPNSIYSKQIHIKVGKLISGNYHFPLLIDFTDDLGERRYLTLINELIVGEVQLANLTISTIALEATGEDTISSPVFIKNEDNFAKDLLIETLSHGMIERSAAIERPVDAYERSELDIKINTLNKILPTQANLIYIISFSHANRHYSEIATNQITILPRPSLFAQFFSQQKIMSILSALGILSLIILSVFKPYFLRKGRL